MGRRVSGIYRRIRRCGLLPVPARLQACAAGQARRSLRPACAPSFRRAALHLRAAQGSPARIHQGPRGAGAFLHILGLSIFHPELCPVHIRRLSLASAFVQNTDRGRTQSIHLLSGHSGRSVSRNTCSSGNSSLGHDSQSPEIRPHTEERIGHYPRADSHADGIHSTDRGVLRRRRRRRPACGCARRRSARQRT